MKKILLAVIILFSWINLWAQTPSSFSYQAVLRNADGSVIANHSATVVVEILAGTTDGQPVFTETHSVTTTAQGVITMNIGSIEDLSVVDWAADTYFIKIIVDDAVLGVTQLLGVPYAFHAKTADNLSGGITETDPVYETSVASGITATDTTSWNGKLDSYVESDPVFTAWDKSTGVEITENQITDLKNYIITETDPAYNASVSSGITAVDTAKWNGKLDNFVETDPTFTSWDKSTGISITESQITNLKNYLTAESDPAVNLNFNFSDAVSGDLLRFDGTKWTKYTPAYASSAHTHNLATTEENGFMSSDDKIKLNGLQNADGTETKINAAAGISVVGTGSLSDPYLVGYNGVAKVPVLTTAEIVELIPVEGQTVYNHTEGLYQIFNGVYWVSVPANCWPQPTQAIAGESQYFTDASTSYSLEANSPAPEHGFGQWSIVAGEGGSFDEVNNPTALFSGLECMSYDLKWTITTSCSSSESSVSITFNQTPSEANAGPNQILTDGTTSTQLSANTPEEGHGTGKWSIVSGEGGSFVDDTDPNTTFTGQQCTDYQLKWTISTSCSSSESTVNISFNQTSTTANAGSDQLFGNGTISTSLSANTPEEGHGIGLWIIISGVGGSFVDDTDPNTTFSGQVFQQYELKWSITSNCDVSSDTVLIWFGQDGPGESVTDVDGNVYSTVWIGSQQWMAQNLRVTKYRNTDPVPLVIDNMEWETATEGAFCIYPYEMIDGLNSDEEVLAAYGALYNWYAAADTRGLCPTGWHLSTDEEWTELTNYLGGESIAGGKLKSTRTQPTEHPRWESGNIATNVSGFSALPGGSRSSIGSFPILGELGNWWNSNEYSTNLSFYRNIQYQSTDVWKNYTNKKNGFSVRCVKD